MEVSINSVNPDVMPQNVARHLVLNCLKTNFLKCGPVLGPSCLQKLILAWEFVTPSCLKPQNPCSNHEIHMLFEHGFYLKKPKLGPDLHA